MQHIYLAVSPSPTRGTPCHLHFIQGMFTKGYSMSRTYTAIIQRPDSFDGEFGIPLPTGAAPFHGSPRSQLPPCPEGSPRRWPACASGSLPLPAHQLGSPLLPRSLGILAPFCLPPTPAEPRIHGRLPAGAGGARRQKENVRELSIATGKSHGRSAQFGGITETVLALEAVGSWGPKAAHERNSPLTRTCMTVPDCLKILGDNSAFA